MFELGDDVRGLRAEEGEVCLVEATVVTGFEKAAQQECLRKTGLKATTARGRILVDVPVRQVKQILSLRSIDSVYVLIFQSPSLGFLGEDKESCLLKVKEIVPQCLWEKGLRVWALAGLGPSVTSSSTSPSHLPLTYRVTCYRTHGPHTFGSPDAAGHLGGAIAVAFPDWRVRLTSFDVEVVLNVVGDSAYVGLGLTKGSLHVRNVTCFGPTTLRATIAHGLLEVAGIRDGDVVCDPMCGSGAVSVEGAVAFPNALHLCGDVHPLGPEKAKKNWENLREKQDARRLAAAESDDDGIESANLGPVDVFRWDATSLPLRPNSVDVFVTDLPFGKRSGSRFDNRTLYPKLLNEFARTCDKETGRAVLLTHDKRTMTNALYKVAHLWKLVRTLSVNIGGLMSAVYYLERRSQQEKTSTKKQLT